MSRNRFAVRVAIAVGLATVAGCEPAPDPEAVRELTPEIPYCDPARDWPEAWALTETRAVELIEDLRQRGADCGENGRAAAAPSLRRSGALTCAARIHAIAMAEQQHVGHTTPDEVDTAQRLDAVDYGGAVLEHLAAGPLDADEAVLGVWRPSDHHCSNLMSRAHIDVGVGFVGGTEAGSEYETYWVLMLGNPPGPNP